MGLDRAAQAAAKLAELSGATPAQAAAALDNFDAKDVIGALAVASPNGGSQTVLRLAVPIAFNTPNLVVSDPVDFATDGITIYTPSAGDLLLRGSLYVETTWNGSTPTLHVCNGNDWINDSEIWDIGDLSSAPAPYSGVSSVIKIVDFSAGLGGNLCLDTSPIRLAVDDDSGGQPGSSQGSGTVYIEILTAAS